MVEGKGSVELNLGLAMGRVVDLNPIESSGSHCCNLLSFSWYGVDTLTTPRMGQDCQGVESVRHVDHLVYPQWLVGACHGSKHEAHSCLFITLPYETSRKLIGARQSCSNLGNIGATIGCSRQFDTETLTTERVYQSLGIGSVALKDLCAEGS